MKFADIKSLTKAELEKKVFLSQKDLFELKMKHSLGQLQNPLEIRKIRRDVARLKTALGFLRKKESKMKTDVKKGVSS